MRRPVRLQITLLVFLGSVVVLAAVPAVAQDQTEGALSFVGSGTEAQTLLLDHSNDASRFGQLEVLLRNESNEEVTPCLDYILAGSGKVIHVAHGEQDIVPPSPTDPVRISLVGDQPIIPPFEAERLSLTVRVARGTRPAAAAGKLVARPDPGKKATVATMAVTPVLSPPWRWQGAVVEPAAITINRTNRLPGFLTSVVGGTEADRTVTVHGVSAETLGSANQSAVLSSSTGGTATLSFDPVPNQDPTAPATGTLKVAQISGVGKYEGNLLLDPEASNSPKLAVTVSAHDFLLWPLLALLAGVLLAWVLLWRRDTRRPKDLVLARIKDIEEANEENTTDNGAPLYTYDGLFPDRYPGWLDWRNCAFVQKPRSASQLYCNVMASRSREELELTQKQVSDLAARVDLWGPTYEATKTLRLALDAARDAASDPENTPDLNPEDIPLIQETRKLLEPRDHPPKTSAEAETLLNKLREQTEVLHSFIEGAKLKKEIHPLYEELIQDEPDTMLESERRELHESDPEAIFQAFLLPATSRAKIAEGNAIGRLRTAQYVLQRLKDAYQPEMAEAEGGVAGGGAAERMDALAIASGGASAVLAFANRLQDARTPEEIRASVRIHDWVDFVVAAVLTSLAYLLAVTYLDTFGTLQHYLAAFVAGASGSLAINWALLPWARSYIGGATTGQPAQTDGATATPPSVK